MPRRFDHDQKFSVPNKFTYRIPLHEPCTDFEMLIANVACALRTSSIVDLNVPNAIAEYLNPSIDSARTPRVPNIQRYTHRGVIDFVDSINEFLM
jgi:hypothetical protein